jgi:hypothetical protein
MHLWVARISGGGQPDARNRSGARCCPSLLTLFGVIIDERLPWEDLVLLSIILLPAYWITAVESIVNQPDSLWARHLSALTMIRGASRGATLEQKLMLSSWRTAIASKTVLRRQPKKRSLT